MNDIRVTKDSGARDVFQTGAQRDVGDNKPVPVISKYMSPYLLERTFDWRFDRNEPLITYESPVVDPDNGLICDLSLNRMQALLERGARKYGENNWEKGIPLQRIYESMIRHLVQAWAGDTTEDHLAAVMVNAMFAMVTEHRIAVGELPEELGNAGALRYGNGGVNPVEYDTGHDINVRNGGT